MSDRNLLAVVPVPLWPANNGYSLRVTGLLGELVNDWNTILVAPRSPASADHTSDLPLVDYQPVDLGGNFATMPWQLDIQALRHAVDGILAKTRPSIVLLWSGTEILGFDSRFPPAVADRIDSATLAALRMRPGLGSLNRRIRMALKAAHYERRVVREMCSTVVVGEADARTLRRISGRKTVHVVPNGVELGPEPQTAWEAAQPTVVFTGVLSFRPNADAVIGFAETAWPIIRAAVPTAKFAIVGREPAAVVRALDSLPGVDVLADVADLRSELSRGWVAVAPMRSGGGIKNKILEAWACGKPVVMSTIASNGLAPGYEAASLVADTPEQLASAVTRLFEDDSLRRDLGRAGYALVGRHHSWSDAARRISELLRAAEAGGARSTGVRIADAPSSERQGGAEGVVGLRRPVVLPPDRGLRIALMLHLAPRKLGSLEDWVIALAERLESRGHAVTVFAREPVHPEFATALRNTGARWESIDRLRESPIQGVMRLRRFDVLHLSFLSPHGRIALMCCLAWPARVLFVDHNSRRDTELLEQLGIRQHRAATGIRRAVMSALAHLRLSGVAGVSEYVRERAMAEMGLDSRRFTAIHNGVDLGRFKPGSGGPTQDGPFTILSVAHLIPAKGVEYLLRAVAGITNHPVRLLVVGDGRDRSRLEELVGALGIEDRTQFCGLRDDVDVLLREADIFVHPALWGEAFGLTIAEAMASGCPVVASEVGGIPELIEDGVSGLLVPPANEAALSAALLRLIEDRALRERLALAARKRAEERFGIDRSVESHVQWCERMRTRVPA